LFPPPPPPYELDVEYSGPDFSDGWDFMEGKQDYSALAS
jgi:hypothetical protein